MVISLSNLKMISWKNPKDRIRFDVTLYDEQERPAVTMKGWTFDQEHRVWGPGRMGRGGRIIPVCEYSDWLEEAIRECIKRDAAGMVSRLPQSAYVVDEKPEIDEIKTETKQ